MSFNLRASTAADAAQWLELIRATLGDHYPARELYDVNWISSRLDPVSGDETWVAESAGQLMASISLLKAPGPDASPVVNLGRNLVRRESVSNGSAAALLAEVGKIISERGSMAVVRISAHDIAQQVLFENLGFVCVGFQPLKHMLQQRLGVLIYARGSGSVSVACTPFSESLPQVSELALAVLENLHIPGASRVRDGACGYPLQTDLKVVDATLDDYELWRVQLESASRPVEVSGRFNYGFGWMRLPAAPQMRGFLGQREDRFVAGLCCFFDEQDRCCRVNGAFCGDDFSMGALLSHVVKTVQEQWSVAYTEMDILASAPRLLKSAEQLGFVPVAYLPAFYSCEGRHSDVVKMVKLNSAYSLGASDFTPHAKAIAQIIDRNFEDQKLGQSIVNLLRPLSMFVGLGDGELRKIARLFVQKLYRAGDVVFAKGDPGDEACIILRGKIGIHLEQSGPAIAQLSDGKIFGELAFLDDAPRAAFALATQPSILLMIKREALADLLRRETSLGMVVMRNLAQDLALKLRAVNESLSNARKPAAAP